MNVRRAHRIDGPSAVGQNMPSPGSAHRRHRTATGNGGASARPVEGIAVPEDTAMAPGAAPPAESGLSGLAAPEREALRRGWAVGPLMLIGIVVVLVVIGLVAMVVALATA